MSRGAWEKHISRKMERLRTARERVVGNLIEFISILDLSYVTVGYVVHACRLRCMPMAGLSKFSSLMGAPSRRSDQALESSLPKLSARARDHC